MPAGRKYSAATWVQAAPSNHERRTRYRRIATPRSQSPSGLQSAARLLCRTRRVRCGARAVSVLALDRGGPCFRARAAGRLLRLRRAAKLADHHAGPGRSDSRPAQRLPASRCQAVRGETRTDCIAALSISRLDLSSRWSTGGVAPHVRGSAAQRLCVTPLRHRHLPGCDPRQPRSPEGAGRGRDAASHSSPARRPPSTPNRTCNRR